MKPMTLGETDVTLGVKTIPGLRYRLRTSTSPDGGWTEVGAPQTAVGARLELSVERDATKSSFYMITVTK